MSNVKDSTTTSKAEAAHTPGPWKWFNYPDGRKLLSAPNRAVIHCPDAPMTCDAADEALIAAAPDLLAAVKAAIAYDEAIARYGLMPSRLKAAPNGLPGAIAEGDDLDALYWDWQSKSVAAIAKAEGRS